MIDMYGDNSHINNNNGNDDVEKSLSTANNYEYDDEKFTNNINNGKIWNNGFHDFLPLD